MAQGTRIYKVIMVLLVVVFLIPLAVLLRHMNGPAHTGPHISNRAINARNLVYADSNSFCFTDRDRAFRKPKGVFRIAVLGDSFIWGDGMPYEQVWSHILEHRLLDEYDSIEVMSWGRDSWSTMNEYRFFKRYGKDFDIDLLIIGWVDNDPDVGRIRQVPATGPEVLYPRLNHMWPWLATHLSYSGQRNGYDKWLRDIYTPDNLKAYQLVLNEFHQYLEAQHVRSLYVMTPAPFEPDMRERFEKAEPMIHAAGFTCVNLYDPMEKKLGHYAAQQLMANPENGHPGILMTQEIAAEVHDYMERNGYLRSVPKRKN